jgi:hypothetical protein
MCFALHLVEPECWLWWIIQVRPYIFVALCVVISDLQLYLALFMPSLRKSCPSTNTPSLSSIPVDFVQFVEVANLQMELGSCHILVPRARPTSGQQSMTRVAGYENGLGCCRSKFSLRTRTKYQVCR